MNNNNIAENSLLKTNILYMNTSGKNKHSIPSFSEKIGLYFHYLNISFSTYNKEDN